MKEQSTAKGFAILSAAGMIVKILSLLYVPFLQIIIGREGYGVYVAAYQIFVFVYVLTNSGVPIAIAKLVSELIALENYKDALKAFKIARAALLILGLISSIVLIGFAYPLVSFSKTPEAYMPIIALAPAVFITSVMSAYRGYFQGLGNMTPTAISQVGEQIINTVFSLVFAALLISKGIELGCVGATTGTTIGALAACIYLIWIYEKNKKTKINRISSKVPILRLSNKVIFRKLISYAIPMTICVGLQNAGTIIDMLVIKRRLLESGFDQSISNIKYGILGTYNTLIFVPITMISALSAAALPSIAGAAARNDRRTVQEKINYTFRLCSIVAVPAAVGLAVLSKPIYSLLFPANIEGHVLMKYGSIVVVLMAIVQIQTTILQSVGKLYVVTISLTLGIFAKIICNYILVAKPEININGAIVGNIICFVIPLIINNIVMKKALRIRVRLLDYLIKPMIASAFMGLIVYITYFNLDTIFMNTKHSIVVTAACTMLPIIIGAIVYAYGLILTGGITKKDLDTVSPRVTRLIPIFIKNRIR